MNAIAACILNGAIGTTGMGGLVAVDAEAVVATMMVSQGALPAAAAAARMAEGDGVFVETTEPLRISLLSLPSRRLLRPKI